MSETIQRAVRVDPKTHAATNVEASEITEADKKAEYYCADCYEKGHKVRLKFVKASERHVTFEKWDKRTEELALDRGGDLIKRDRQFHLPAHFDRWPGARDHQCDQPVRYARFRENALFRNGKKIGDHSYIFPIRLPGNGAWNNHDGVRPEDLRAAFRPAGMDLGGIQDAETFRHLLKYFERDPGLQHYQYFHDGYQTRKFDETYFESPRALYEYLKRENAVGRSKAVIVAYLLNTNTSAAAIRNYREGYVDRSAPKLPDGKRLELFVRGMNAQAEEALYRIGREDRWFQQAPVLVLAEARIDDRDLHHVEIEFYNPAQITPWESKMRFLPKSKPGMDGQAVLEL